MNARGTASARPAPGQFRCLVCQTVVTGTLSGHCPRCGFVPPTIEIERDLPLPRSPVLAIGMIAATMLLLATVLLR